MAIGIVRQKGFTLIEVMIVLALIAIIAALAAPSYSSHVCKVQRNQAKGDLMAYAQAMERFYSTNNFRYRDADDKVPSVYSSHSPADGPATEKRFDLTLTVPNDGGSFSLSAQRSGGSCGDGTLTLNSAGMRTWIRDGVTQGDWDE